MGNWSITPLTPESIDVNIDDNGKVTFPKNKGSEAMKYRIQYINPENGCSYDTEYEVPIQDCSKSAFTVTKVEEEEAQTTLWGSCKTTYKVVVRKCDGTVYLAHGAGYNLVVKDVEGSHNIESGLVKVSIKSKLLDGCYVVTFEIDEDKAPKGVRIGDIIDEITIGAPPAAGIGDISSAITVDGCCIPATYTVKPYFESRENDVAIYAVVYDNNGNIVADDRDLVPNVGNISFNYSIIWRPSTTEWCDEKPAARPKTEGTYTASWTSVVCEDGKCRTEVKLEPKGTTLDLICWRPEDPSKFVIFEPDKAVGGKPRFGEIGNTERECITYKPESYESSNITPN